MDSIFNYEHPFVCTDAVIFTVETDETDNYRKLPETKLKVLLYKRDKPPFEGLWCLPGGFLNIDELPDVNIRRKIFAKTNVDNCYLEQLYTFCDISRDPRARVLSLSYLGLMSESASKNFENQSMWVDIKFHFDDRIITFKKDDLYINKENFAFDHHNIIKTAIERLRSKVQYTDIIFNLLPKEFTLTQLQTVYETIFGRSELTANFRRKFSHLVQETNNSTSNKGHRPAKLYKKKGDVYDG